MIVVLCMGLLAGVAIPGYTKFQARARQAEAKIALAAIHTAEKSFWGEQGTYTLCIRDAGYVADGNKRYYAIGFLSDAVAGCGPDGLRTCAGFSYSFNAAPPAASSAVADTVCAVGIGDPALPATATAYSANVRHDSAGPVAVTNLAEQTAAFPAGPAPCPVRQTSFIACAAGNVGSNGYDVWSIDEQKNMVNVRPGI